MAMTTPPVTPPAIAPVFTDVCLEEAEVLVADGLPVEAVVLLEPVPFDLRFLNARSVKRVNRSDQPTDYREAYSTVQDI